MMVARSIFALALGLLWFVSMPAAARTDDCASSSGCPAQTDPAPVPKPSFDCAKATTAVEKAICADPVLANWDRNMAGMFSLILAGARPDTRKTVLAAQNAWLSQLSNCVPVVPAPEPITIGEQAAATDATASPTDATASPKDMSSCLLDAYQHYDQDVTPRLKFLVEGLKFPFLPRLTFSNGDALCRKFLDGAIIDYETVRGQPDDLKDPHIVIPGGRWIDWNWDKGGAIAAERVDLDGKGQLSLLAEKRSWFNYLTDIYELYVQAVSDPASLINDINTLAQGHHQDPHLRKLTQLDTEGGHVGHLIIPNILSYDGKYYRLHNERNDDIPFMGASIFSLDRIHADGSLDPTCRVNYFPEIKGLAQPSNRPGVQSNPTDQPSDVVEAPESVLALFDSIDRMQGYDVGQGTMRPVTWQRNSSHAAQYNSSFVPGTCRITSYPMQIKTVTRPALRPRSSSGDFRATRIFGFCGISSTPSREPSTISPPSIRPATASAGSEASQWQNRALRRY